MKREIKRRLKEQRRAMKAELRAKRAQLAEMRRARKKPRRFKRRWLLLLLLLLLLLIEPCDPVEPGVSTPKKPIPPPPVTTSTPAEVVTKRKLTGRVRRRKRPDYETPAPSKKQWLDAFRLQVSGRSLRLSACFEGVSRPGAVRWVAAVDPSTGRVSDHELEPVAASVALTRAQKKCVTGVLSDPPYRLDATNAPPSPERVGLVLEF